MKRAIRQRCGFGCVICGLPLYEYEHMLGFATVQRHVAEEITLLCDQHHRERTNGLLSIEAVREANASPFNFMAGVSRPYDLHFEGDECEVQIGSNRFTMQRIADGIVLIPVMVDGIPLIAFTLGDGHLVPHPISWTPDDPDATVRSRVIGHAASARARAAAGV